MLQNILSIGIGSLFGGICRYLLADFIKHLFPTTFPWGTLGVNLTGCFIIGLLSGWMASSSWFTVTHRMIFIVGFCGSFTTFSTFSMENLNLLESKAYGLFAFNTSMSVGAGLFCTFMGYALTHR